jgi:hypothetical protein
VIRWLSDLKAGNDGALLPLWERYYARLVEQGWVKLRGLGSTMAVRDEQDLASSAFESLYRAFARAGSLGWRTATTSGSC